MTFLESEEKARQLLSYCVFVIEQNLASSESFSSWKLPF